MSYTSFSQKPHFLSRNGICCFCVERSCFILPTCLFSFLAWLEPPMFSRRKRNSCRRIWASKKDKEKHWPLFCAIALFSLPVCMSHSRAEACVCTSSVAVWDFLTCLQFFLHTLFFPNKQKNRKKRVRWDPPNLLQPAHTLLEKVAHLTAFMQFVGESDACISMNCT